jgi:hypothetical protein
LTTTAAEAASRHSFKYLGNSVNGVYGIANGDSLLAEWTYNFQTGQVDPNSYRELFRVNMPLQDHPIKQARFDPYARPGDADYGLLYMTHGGSNPQESPNNDPQDRGDLSQNRRRSRSLARRSCCQPSARVVVDSY